MADAQTNRLLWGAALGMVAFAGWTAWTRLGPASTPATPALPETAHAAALPAPRVADTRTDWLRAHFAFPLAAQGTPPADWTPVEADLSSATCGACHVAQYADWQTSWHAGAMGPGVMGQLVDWDHTQDGLVDQCQTCHAPLAEQDPRVDGSANPVYQAALRSEGVSCASCHVRAWTRYGPPVEAPVADAPHDGFVARDEYRDAGFCTACHDFKPGQKSLEGKLLQETWSEWAVSRYAEEGVSCQDCHMPEGRHLWKGIHDPDMVRSALTATLSADATAPGGYILSVTNSGAGHRLPTYTTPQLTLVVEQLGADGTVLPGSAQEGAIARRVKPDLTTELFDTRLLPGESHVLTYRVPRQPGAVSVRARIACWPDEAYRRFYEIKLRDPAYGPLGRAQIEEALARSVASRFAVWETTLAY